MVEAYVAWREERAGVWRTYESWCGASTPDRRGALSGYLAALEREEQAARVYADLVTRLAE